MKDFLLKQWLGNSMEDYLWFLATILLGLIFRRLISKYFSRLLFKVIKTKHADLGVERFDKLLTKPISLSIMLSIIFIASSHIEYPASWNLVNENEFGIKMLVNKSFSLLFIGALFWILLSFIDFIGLILKRNAELTENKMDDQLIPFIIEIGKIIVYILAIFIIMGSIFNVNIAALATGLGIGGIALAMASKESLENLLGSFTIFFDKPFTVGDIVTLGGVTGVVEKVGFRSTRIRTFDKSIVTVPNKNIISSELDNLGARPVRRVKFNIGLTYDATVNNIKAIVNDIQELIDKHPETNNDGKVRFLNFGASSLDIMVLYYVNSPDWEVLIDTQEKINYSIIDIVAKHKCDFAFPSTSVYIEKNNN